jgi:hypothetical protein
MLEVIDKGSSTARNIRRRCCLFTAVAYPPGVGMSTSWTSSEGGDFAPSGSVGGVMAKARYPNR